VQLEQSFPEGAKRLIVVVSDGALAEEDRRLGVELAKNKPRVLFLPVLLCVSESEVQSYINRVWDGKPIGFGRGMDSPTESKTRNVSIGFNDVSNSI
jgi:hypothetical protein